MRYEVKGELGDLPGYNGPPDAPIVFLWVYDLIDVLVYDFVYQLFIDYSHSCFFLPRDVFCNGHDRNKINRLDVVPYSCFHGSNGTKLENCLVLRLLRNSQLLRNNRSRWVSGSAQE